MAFPKVAALFLLPIVVSLFLLSCRTPNNTSTVGALTKERLPQIAHVMTSDVQEGIERHIREEVKAGKGYFRIPFEGRELNLELVRVHTEYLAVLSPTKFFACVDMVSVNGEFYDVDFFMEGSREQMTVTETTVHKLNGRPYYVWKQAQDKTWKRMPVDKASDDLLGVRQGKDSFTFWYQAVIPAIDKEGRMWLPLAQSDNLQDVRVSSIDLPAKHRVLTDQAYGNKVIFLELKPEDSGKKINITYEVRRKETGAFDGESAEAQKHLKSNKRIKVDEQTRKIALELIKGKDNDLMRARALYDHVIDTMSYKRCGQGWGQGDATHARCSLFGNCTDFHSYFIALARSIGIPARFVIGAAIPVDRDEGGIDGYHCWAEFFVEGKWWPVDISEGNKFTALSMYYFGHHPANRFEFTRGRDLLVDPGPVSGPINFLAYPLLEVAGERQAVKIAFGFKRNKAE